jgi:uncharacterized protein
MPTLEAIRRFPVKGLSPEEMNEVDLAAGRGIPGDRAYALALAETQFDESNPRPLPKTKFAVLARFTRLAELWTQFDFETSTLSLSRAGSLIASGNVEAEAGRKAIEQAIHEFMGTELGGPPRLVKGNGHRFTDVSVHSPLLMEAISMINLATVRAFEEELGEPVDPRRFRGNLLVDGIAPWSEFELIDRTFSIGDVTVKGVRRTKRCPATEVNPNTAERDLRVPLELLNRYSHGDLGIYVTVLSDGAVRRGDRIRLSSSQANSVP